MQVGDPQQFAESPWEQPDDENAPPASTSARELIETVLFILLVFFILRGVVQNFRVDGASMEPNFTTDQYILVNKIVFFHFDVNAPLRLLPGMGDLPPQVLYPFRMPERGDVVVLEAPTSSFGGESVDYIKRVVALPGEIVQVKDGKVFVNGQPLDESAYLSDSTDCLTGKLCEPYTVPEGTVVVMGDHRSNSQDSRSWGAEPGLPLERVVGKAWLSYWPRDEWAVIPSPTYAQTP
jgi:signal peptidase I